MTKTEISTNSKEIALYFCKAIGQPVDRNISRYIKSIKILLLEYTKDEIIIVINHCIKHQPKGGIYSFGYIVYNMAEVIAPIRKQVLLEKAKKEEANDKDYGDLPEASDNTNKLKRIGNRKEFNWDG